MAFFGYNDAKTLVGVDVAIYEYILAHETGVPFMHVRDLAAGAHVSNSSVMRFIRKMGYSSFPEFKVAFHKQSLDASPDLETGVQLLTAETFPSTLQRTLDLVAQTILTANNVVFTGTGSSANVAEYASRLTSTLGINSFPVTDPYYPLIPQLKQTTKNVLITLSVSGQAAEVLGMLRQFQNDPATTLISITGHRDSPIAMISTYALTYHTTEHRIHGHYDLTSQLPAMTIVEALARTIRRQAQLPHH